MPASLALRLQATLAQRTADTRPTSWREDDLSVEAVAATETPTRMSIWEYDREYGGYRSTQYDEILDVSGLTEADLQAFVGCPILDSHASWSTDSIVGVVDEARREGTDLVVRFRLAKTEEAIVGKVRDGIIRKVSIGYQRRTGATITEREGDVPLRRQPFTPCELSLVAVGADPNAATRTAANVASLNQTVNVTATATTQEPTMNVDAIRSAMTAFTTAMTAALAEASSTPAQPATPANGTRAADPVDQAGQDAIEGRRNAPVQTAPQAPTAPVLRQRSAAEIEAIGHIRKIAVDGGRGAQFDAMEKAGEPLAGLRQISMGCLVTTSPETNGTTSGGDGQRSAEPMLTFEETVRGQRSAGGDVQALAQALAGFVSR